MTYETVADTVVTAYDGFIWSKDAAEILGIQQDTLCRWAREGKVLARRFGRTWFIDTASVEAQKKRLDAVRRGRRTLREQGRIETKRRRT